MRAISVLTVILGHSAWYFPPSIKGIGIYRYALGNSRNGVTVFFVISGFLITSLLLQEIERTGQISLRRFYFRRSMRIFPAFYVYLSILGLLWLAGKLPESLSSFLASATYTWCYFPDARGLYLQHSWSLSIEEQFYLAWPMLLVGLHAKRKFVRATAVLIVVPPIVRLIAYFCFPRLRGVEYYLIYGWVDTMMVGCLLALLNRTSRFCRLKQRFLNGWAALLMATVAFYINPFLTVALPGHLNGFFILVVYPVTTALCIGGTMLYLVEHSDSLVGKLLNLKWLRGLGALSYSLYLWQQLFLSYELKLLPWGYLYLFTAAFLSFFLVEKPLLRLRDKLEATSASPSESRMVL